MRRVKHIYLDSAAKLRPGAIALALFLLSSHPLFAQEQLLPVFHFKALEGFGPEIVSARVVRDSLGFVWIGARNGLQRYDGYNFKKYHNIPNDSHSLPSNRISSLLVDSRGRLWVGTEDRGLSLYDPARERFIRLYPNPDDSSRSETTAVNAMIEDRSDHIWLAMSSPYDVVRVEIPTSGESNDNDSLAASLHFRKFPIGTPGFGANDICERNDGKILIASHTGLIVLDPASADVSRPHLTAPIGHRLDSILVLCLVQGSDGKLWLGTATEGVFRIDWQTGKVANFRHREGDSLSITIDEIWDMAEDRRGNMWIGTVNGVELLSPETGKRIPYLTYEQPFGGYKGIRLSVDCTGAFWVGTASDLYLLTARSQHFPHFSFWNRWRPQNRPSSQTPGPTHRNWQALGSFQDIERAPDGYIWGMSEGKLLEIDPVNRSIIKTIDVFETNGIKTFGTSSLLDKKGNFWHVAWDLGLFRVNLTSGKVTNYNYDPPSGKTTTLLTIEEGPGDSLWIGAYNQGVFKFSPVGGRFLATRFNAGYGVMRDHQGKFWITGYDGLNVFDPVTGMTDKFVNVPSDPHSLGQTFTQGTSEDSSGRIWVGSRTVINLWNPATRSFTRYPNPAFSVYDVYPIGSDSRGRLWVIYANGDLSILDPSSGRYVNLSQDDGLCSSITSMLNLKDGRILLSGWAGVNLFSADSVDPDLTPPPLVITRMTINDEPVGPPRLLKGSGSLRLSHTQDVLEFEFAAIDIDPRGPAEYRYQLEGYERDWVKPTDRRFVRYTNIPPGDYVFKVRAASTWDRWPDQEITLAVTIAPPWWRTTWAYAAYVFLFIGLLYAGYRVRLRQIHLQQEVELGQFKAEHLAEVDRLKSRFFANISHEFRTPLTLILGSIQKWQERTHEEDEKKDLRMAERNAHRLLRLINQLLDLSKLEAGAMKLQASRMNIVPLVKGIASSFESSAGIRGVALNVHVEHEEIDVYCDRDMVEKILSNLLSNAFKFTPAGGRVTVTVTQFRTQNFTEFGIQSSIPRSEIAITVSDTGIGIPPEQLDKVFDRFYQVDASQTREHEGSGLGLALVKELVELHHGAIQVRSEVGHGTTFTVQLPLGRSHLRDDEVVDTPISVEPTRRDMDSAIVEKTIEGAEEGAEHARGEKPIVLIVEDNADVRAYIRDYLIPMYQVTEARDGTEGIEKAWEVIPDLIISDVMMPKKDGYEVCRTLKLDERTSHIPIILLTARAASDDKIEGLETGADDYLIKPFEPKELLARIKNLIDLRQKLRERFKLTVPVKPGEVAVASMDEVFLSKVISAVEHHIGDELFSTEELAAEVAMSRMQLHRKLSALTNQSAGEFIRSLRLHRAMELLQKDVGTVSEIAYMVGFSDPSYFSKCFHKQFGKVPTEVKMTPGQPKSLG